MHSRKTTHIHTHTHTHTQDLPGTAQAAHTHMTI